MFELLVSIIISIVYCVIAIYNIQVINHFLSVMILIAPICSVMLGMEAWDKSSVKKLGENIDWPMLGYFLLYPAFLLKPILLPVAMFPVWFFTLRNLKVY